MNAHASLSSLVPPVSQIPFKLLELNQAIHLNDTKMILVTRSGNLGHFYIPVSRSTKIKNLKGELLSLSQLQRWGKLTKALRLFFVFISFNVLVVSWKCGKVQPLLLDRYYHSCIMKLLSRLLIIL